VNSTPGSPRAQRRARRRRASIEASLTATHRPLGPDRTTHRAIASATSADFRRLVSRASSPSTFLSSAASSMASRIRSSFQLRSASRWPRTSSGQSRSSHRIPAHHAGSLARSSGVKGANNTAFARFLRIECMTSSQRALYAGQVSDEKWTSLPTNADALSTSQSTSRARNSKHEPADASTAVDLPEPGAPVTM
jgi:hypothetical protein